MNVFVILLVELSVFPNNKSSKKEQVIRANKSNRSLKKIDLLSFSLKKVERL